MLGRCTALFGAALFLLDLACLAILALAAASLAAECAARALEALQFAALFHEAASIAAEALAALSLLTSICIFCRSEAMGDGLWGDGLWGGGLLSAARPGGAVAGRVSGDRAARMANIVGKAARLNRSACGCWDQARRAGLAHASTSSSSHLAGSSLRQQRHWQGRHRATRGSGVYSRSEQWADRAQEASRGN